MHGPSHMVIAHGHTMHSASRCIAKQVMQDLVEIVVKMVIRCVHGSPFVSVFQIVMAWLVRSVSAVSSTCGSGLQSDRDVHRSL
jgi:hypothetical protein